MTRPMRAVQHEAAHVVVGCALGMRLERAWVRDPSTDPPPGMHPQDEGAVLWATSRSNLAYAVMCAAGIAWEHLTGGHPSVSAVDRRLVREHLRAPGVRADVRTAVACADALLRSRMALHARVSRLLAERDITGVDVQEIVERSAGG